jgi:VWFA-related protein
MPRLLKCILSSTLTLATLVAAQTHQPTQAPTPTVQSLAPTKPLPTTTIRTGAKLVIVDVTVNDKNGKPLHGLKKEDFTVLESGNQQTINAFDEHIALSATDALKFSPLPSLPPGVFTNVTPAPVNSAVNILLIDFLNTPYEDQAYMRAQLTDYLNHARPGISIAIFTLNNTLHMLQGFTSDPEILKQALNRLAGRPSALLGKAQTGGDISSDMPLTQGRQHMVNAAGFDDTPPAVQAPAIAAAIQTLQQAIQGNSESYQRQRTTLDSFNVLARYLVNISGRKNLIWFSGSFPIEFLPNNSLNPTAAIQDSYAGQNNFAPNPGSIPVTDPFASTNVDLEFRQTTDLLSRNQVAVYPVDARGVVDSPAMQPDSGTTVNNNGNPSDINNDKSAFEHSLAAEHSTMERLAYSTGGRPFINDNDLSRAVAKAIELGSNYYTLSYTPANENWKGDFRKIEVRFARKGYTLAYRRGYFATDPDMPQNTMASPGTTPAMDANAKENARLVRASMIHGAPGSTEILYKVRVLPADEVEDVAAEGNVLSPLGLRQASGRFRRYVVDFDVDAKDMLFTPRPDGGFDCKVEFVVQVYQNDGQLVNTISNTLVATLSLAQRNKLIRSGFPFHEEISVPLNGDYSMRIGVHDFNSDHIGAVEVPVASVKDLPLAPNTHVAAKAVPTASEPPK